MPYLVGSAAKDGLAELRAASPNLWREIRRYNLPVQLALGAAADIVRLASEPSSASIFSVAPCHAGSADLFRWAEIAVQRLVDGYLGDTRMNPTHTLHVVDNLAMSAFAIAHKNQAYCLGLGGAAGQAWVAFDAIQERLAEGKEREAFLLAGDQHCARDSETGLGIALLFSESRQPYSGRSGVARYVKLLGVERRRRTTPKDNREVVVPHSSAGLRSLLSALDRQGDGQWTYEVPWQDSDGLDDIYIRMEVSECRTAAV